MLPITAPTTRASAWLSLFPCLPTVVFLLLVPAAASDLIQPSANVFGKLPLSFESNRGQLSSNVQFVSRSPGFQLYLTKKEVVLSLQTKSKAREVIRLEFLGANQSARISGSGELPGTTSYFVGNDPQRWRTGIANYGQVRYDSIYPGVDLVFYGAQDGRLEHDFVVAPGNDADRIRFRVSGATKVIVDDEGNLNLVTSSGSRMRLERPSVYQMADGRRVPVEGEFRPTHKGVRSSVRGREFGFKIGSYDHSKPLIIDPVLSYATYLGGNADDSINAIAVDGTGSAYVTGKTYSSNFPGRTGPLGNCVLDGVPSCSGDVFVSKINPAGTAVLYTAYIGGAGTESGTGIAVDADGNAFVTGTVISSNFPITSGVATNSSSDVFAFKLNASGTQLVYSTRVGGGSLPFNDIARIAVDPAGNAYIASGAVIGPFTSVNGFRSTFVSSEGFLVKLNPTATQVLYATLIGGSDQDLPDGLAVNSAGIAYVVGVTGSTDFPLKNAIKSSKGADDEAFLIVIDTTQVGSASLVYSSFLGGSSSDEAMAVALDPSGNIYISGRTNSADFPVVNAFLSTYPVGFLQGFLTKLNPSGSARLYSTYFGVSSIPFGQTFFDATTPYSIAADPAGKVWIAGSTTSNALTMLNPLKSTCSKDANNACAVGFVAEFDTTQSGPSSLLFSSYLGGTRLTGAQQVSGAALDPAGNIYLGGSTNSADFAPPPTSLQVSCGSAGTSCQDGFLLKIGNAALPAFASLSTKALNFVDAGVGLTSPAQSVILSNLGGAAFSISSVTASGEFGQSNNCPASLGAGSTCTIQVTLSPVSIGNKTGVLTIATNLPNSPLTVALSGNGVVFNPVPTLDSIFPTTKIAGKPAFALVVNGTNYLPNSVVRWNGSDRGTTFTNSIQMFATVNASDIANPGTAQVTVFNPGPGGGTSTAIPFTITPNTPPLGALEVVNDLADNDNVIKQSGTLHASGWAADPDDGSPVSKVEVRLNSPGLEFYVVDSNNFRIRKINSSGVISNFAGTGVNGFSGDGGIATAAKLFPSFTSLSEDGGSVIFDNNGNLYLSDMGNQRVRRIAAGTNIITTIAGTGAQTSTGDGGLATAATMLYPDGMAFDSNGNLFVSEKNKIRRIDATSKIITTVAGTTTGFFSGGFSGDGGNANLAVLNNPKGMAFDVGGNLYFADTGNSRVRRIQAGTNIITTVAGNGNAIFAGDGGLATSASLARPYGVAFDSLGNLLITDTGNRQLRRVDMQTGIINTISTTAVSGFGAPMTVTVDGAGNIYVVDKTFYRIIRIAAGTGVASVYAGTGTYGSAGDGGPATSATFAIPTGGLARNSGLPGITATGTAVRGGSRPDIAASTGHPNYATSGWTLDMNIGAIPVGSYKVDALAYDSSAATTVLGPAKNIVVTQSFASQAQLSTTALNFNGVFIFAQTLAKNVTLTNIGNATMTITSFAATGDYSVAKTCGDTIPVGGTCTLQIKFRPMALGTRNGSAVLTTNAPGSPTVIQMFGSGVDMVLTAVSRPGRPRRSAVANSTMTNFELSIALNGGGSLGSVALDCSAPLGLSCSVEPAAINLDDSSQVQVSVETAQSSRAKRLKAAERRRSNRSVKVTARAETFERSIVIPVP